MKLMKQLFPVFLMVFLMASCTEDDGPGTGATLPTSDITTLTSTVIPVNGSFQVSLTGNDGDSPLNTLTITKDGSTIPLTDIMYGGAAASANPRLLLGTDKTSFTYTIDVQTDLAANESATYAFVVTAENGDETTESVVITAEEASMDPPVLEFNGSVTEANNLFQIPLTATLGSDSLQTISVYEDDVLVASTRLTLGAMTVWNENPYTLPSSLKGGFAETLLLSLPTTNGTYSYVIIVADPAGLSDSVAFSAEVNLGTALTGGVAGVTVENFAGPNPTGGLDCTTGAVSGSSAAAHIMDNGNDTNADWNAQIKVGAAGSELRRVTGTFADFQYKEEISAAYDAGTTGSIFTVTAGELYVVLGTDGVYYLAEFASVNNTVGDNLDSYTINTKF